MRLQALQTPQQRLQFGTSLRVEVAVQLAGLAPEDVVVELLIGRPERQTHQPLSHRLACGGSGAAGECLFALDLTPELCGRLEYRIRMYPYHAELIHKFEMGLMVWL